MFQDFLARSQDFLARRSPGGGAEGGEHAQVA